KQFGIELQGAEIEADASHAVPLLPIGSAPAVAHFHECESVGKGGQGRTWAIWATWASTPDTYAMRTCCSREQTFECTMSRTLMPKPAPPVAPQKSAQPR